jgi:hypothetical protein
MNMHAKQNWVVRNGGARNVGSYKCDHAPGQWSRRQEDATRYATREEAAAVAAQYDGRVVRLLPKGYRQAVREVVEWARFLVRRGQGRTALARAIVVLERVEGRSDVHGDDVRTFVEARDKKVCR